MDLEGVIKKIRENIGHLVWMTTVCAYVFVYVCQLMLAMNSTDPMSWYLSV